MSSSPLGNSLISYIGQALSTLGRLRGRRTVNFTLIRCHADTATGSWRAPCEDWELCLITDGLHQRALWGRMGFPSCAVQERNCVLKPVCNIVACKFFVQYLFVLISLNSYNTRSWLIVVCTNSGEWELQGVQHLDKLVLWEILLPWKLIHVWL